MSENRICHQGQKTGHTYKISMGTIISEHTGRSSCLRWCQRTTHHSFIFILSSSVPNDVRMRASLLWNPRLPLAQEAKTKTSPILLAQSGQRRLARIFSNFWRTSALRWEPIHLPTPAGDDQQRPLRELEAKSITFCSHSQTHSVQCEECFWRIERYFQFFVSSMSVRTPPPPHDQQLRESLKLS